MRMKQWLRTRPSLLYGKGYVGYACFFADCVLYGKGYVGYTGHAGYVSYAGYVGYGCFFAECVLHGKGYVGYTGYAGYVGYAFFFADCVCYSLRTRFCCGSGSFARVAFLSLCNLERPCRHICAAGICNRIVVIYAAPKITPDIQGIFSM